MDASCGYDPLPEAIARLRVDFPLDIVSAPQVNMKTARERGDLYSQGEAVDEWGCVFTNLGGGIFGEVRRTIVPQVGEAPGYRVPRDILLRNSGEARDTINRFGGGTEQFVLPSEFPRPWERYQFLYTIGLKSVRLVLDELAVLN